MTPFNLRVRGPAGALETRIERPEGALRGLALIAHPHPLHGGTMDNKVVATLARTATAQGFVAVRSNFRGVGQSSGLFDNGIGESEDLLTIARVVGTEFPGLDWTLLGFSFGAFVQHRVAQQLSARKMILVGPAIGLYDFDPPAIPAHIIHGSDDEVVPIGPVRAYAAQYQIPMTELAGAGHFFHGQLIKLRGAVERLFACEIEMPVNQGISHLP